MRKGDGNAAGAILALAFGVAVLGCNSQESPSSGPPGDPVLGIRNGTTLNVHLFVNSKDVRTIGANSGATSILSGSLPPPPWTVEVKSESGRVILSLAVTSVDPAGMSGQVAEADLTCGTLRLWTGSRQPSGPPPPTDAMGDCSP